MWWKKKKKKKYGKKKRTQALNLMAEISIERQVWNFFFIVEKKKLSILKTWSKMIILGDSNGIWTHNHLIRKRTLNHLAILWLKLQIWRLLRARSSLTFRQTIECRFTLKLVRDMIITYSHDNRSWLDDTLMKSNHDTCHLLVFSCEKIKMKIGNFGMENRTCVKLLGVHIDNRLTVWLPYIRAT